MCFILPLITTWIIIFELFDPLSLAAVTTPRPEASQSVIEAYLTRFGYLEVPDSEKHGGVGRSRVLDSKQVSDGIKLFQEKYGLIVTGVFDDATKKKIQQPRCGVKDILGRSPLGKWKVNNLKYKFIGGLTPHMRTSAVKEAIQSGFDYWSKVTPLTFQEVTDDEKAHFFLKFKSKWHDDEYPFDGQDGTLAHAFFPPDGRIHFDLDEMFTEGEEKGYNLRIVAAHEIGHALGLPHSYDPYSLMAAYYAGYTEKSVPLLNGDDISNVQRIYGRKPQSTTPLMSTESTKPRRMTRIFPKTIGPNPTTTKEPFTLKALTPEQTPIRTEELTTTKEPTTTKLSTISTKEPTTTEKIIQTKEPTTTEKIIQTKEPTTTTMSTLSTKEPTTTEKIIQTKKLTTTEKIIQTKEPTTTTMSTLSTKEPTTTEKIIQTKEPTTTEKIIQTKEPTTTEKIIQTKEPTTTEKIIQTKKLTTTEKIIQTKKPITTTVMISTTTEEPELTEKQIITNEVTPATKRALITHHQWPKVVPGHMEPDVCSTETKLNVAFMGKDSRMYFIIKYKDVDWIYQNVMQQSVISAGWPYKLRDYFKNTLPTLIDAVVFIMESKTHYLFSGTKIFIYDENGYYEKEVSTAKDVKYALNLRDGRTIVVTKDNSAWEFNPSTYEFKDSQPISNLFTGLPVDIETAAENYPWSRDIELIFFFKGREYYKYNALNMNLVSSGDVGGPFFGCRQYPVPKYILKYLRT